MARNRGRNRGNRPTFDPGRRRFLTGMAGAASAAVLPGCGSSTSPGSSALPDPAQTGIDHIIVVMMENRSFDHFLGWLPGADGRQAGLSYSDTNGDLHATWPLAPEFQGCAYADPDHSVEGGFTQFNNGACDGFLKTAPVGDTFPIGYYTQADLAFFGQLAPAWTVYDRYFTSIMAETYPNRFYMHAAQTPRMHNGPFQDTVQGALSDPDSVPTIWDRLAAAGQGLTGRYYYSDIPFLGLWGSKYIDNGTAVAYSQFAADCAAGTLPNVAFVDPQFNDEGSGTSRDDHPFADIRDGQVFMSQIYNAVVASPQWPRTALFFTYDEWGGFYDHVPPPDSGVIPDADRQACADENLTPFSRMGFRVPTICVSPFARRGHVSHETYDHTSILKMIEWRWNLPALTVRDAHANNIATSLNFSTRVPEAPAINVTNTVYGTACGTIALAPGSKAARAREKHIAEWRALRQIAARHGYPVGKKLG